MMSGDESAAAAALPTVRGAWVKGRKILVLDLDKTLIYACSVYEAMSRKLDWDSHMVVDDEHL